MSAFLHVLLMHVWYSSPSTAVTSRVICDSNWVPMSVLIVVGEHACLPSMSIITLATAGAVSRVVGYVSNYIE